ncbi:hypothetical protein Poly30_16240 [Planctomycetes bacterium Poly30]|uniref:FG-GAP repeat protein n=1 Tax=Saltatorellus ferox TaxID=2528018 RepID=A0A518EPW0_9BACT|nr:hypothetical protein Poly30_16240 [Planctomycetes bacterium Poly30]
METHLLPLSAVTVLAAGALPVSPGEDGVQAAVLEAPEFAEPVLMLSAGTPVSTEAPGYASPAWYDVDGDGRSDLVVGQFKDGKMRVYHQTEDGTLGEGSWLMAEGEVAEVPGVW